MAPKQHASDVFRSMDKDGNGKIDRNEYTQALIKMNIPTAIANVVTDSVFAKYDTNKDEGIDEKEFVKYFDDDKNAAVHQHIYRSNFEEKYTIIWAMYFIAVGMKMFVDTKATMIDVFPEAMNEYSEKMGPAIHMMSILGLSWITGGLCVLMQRVLHTTQVFAYATVAIFWSCITIYENLVGSIVGESTFQAPPIIVTMLSISLGVYGIWSIQTERAKIKED